MPPQVISRDPAVMGGTPVFHGTLVPMQTLLDYLEAGDTIDEFLDGFQSVTRDHSLPSSNRRRIAWSKRPREGLPRRMR